MPRNPEPMIAMLLPELSGEVNVAICGCQELV